MIKFSEQQIVEAATIDNREVTNDAVKSSSDEVRSRFALLEKLGFSTFDARGEAQAFRGILLTEIKRVFDANQDKVYWKNPFVAHVPMIEASALMAGIELYHAGEGKLVSIGLRGVTIESAGYQAD